LLCIGGVIVTIIILRRRKSRDKEDSTENYHYKPENTGIDLVSAPVSDQYSSGKEVQESLQRSGSFKIEKDDDQEKVQYTKFDDVEKALNEKK